MSIDDVLTRIEAEAETRDLPILGPDKAQVLAAAVRARAPVQVLEIGTLIGYSALVMIAAMPPTGRITCVERDGDVAAEARRNFRSAGVESRVTVVVGDALAVIPILDGPFELVFIDAEKTQYLDYLRAAEPLLSADAVVVADNVGPGFSDRVAPYLDHVRTSKHYASTHHAVGTDALEVSRRIA